MTPLSDDVLGALIRSDPAKGWRAFIDQYTPLIVAGIRRAGVVERDDVMDVYVTMCELLSANDFERLKSQDGSRGSLGGWLTVVARHTVVDWLRSRKGRRRLFQAIQKLPRLEQRVFELFYWDQRMPSEIAEVLSQEHGAPADLTSVFDALERVQLALTDRHHAELLALASRSHPPLGLDESAVSDTAADPHPDPEALLRLRRAAAQLDAAIASLPAEDAALVRLKYIEGLTTRDVEHALGAGVLTPQRLKDILDRLRVALAADGLTTADSVDAALFDTSPL